MSLNGILSTSLTGLFANQEALRTTGANITNVNTPEFSRQRVQLEADVQSGVSVGVKITAIERVVDRFLEVAVLSAKSDNGRYDAMSKIHDRLQTTLGKPDAETSLSARMNAVFGSLAGLALNPADAVTRQQFLSVIQGYTEEVSRIGNMIQSLRGEASGEMESRIEGINEAIRTVFELNPKIRQQKAIGGETGGLENQRQIALGVIAENLDIRIVENGDGSVDVVTVTGSQLVTRGNYSELSYQGPGLVGPETDFPPVRLHRINPLTGERDGLPHELNGDILSGALRGLMDMRDRQLVDLSVALGELAARTMDEFNAVHNRNSAVPAPSVLEGKTTPYAGSDPHNFTGSTTFAVLDSSNRVVASTTYDFSANPAAGIDDVVSAVTAGLGGAGSLSFVNGVMTLSASNPANGVAIAEDPATASDRAGRGFSHFFGMNDLLVARSSGLFETGIKASDGHNFGPGQTVEFRVVTPLGREVVSHVIDIGSTSTYSDILTELNDPARLGRYFDFTLDGAGKLDIAPKPDFLGFSLETVNDTTDSAGTGVGFTSMFGIGNRFRAEAAIDFRLSEEVPDNAGLLATAKFDLAAPVGGVALARGDQRGAIALQELETKVINTADAGELAAQARTLSSFNGAVLGNFAVAADRVASSADTASGLLTEIDQRRQSISGVNLDEELSNLIVFQNAYNAAARVLSSVQELYDALLSAV